MDYKSIQIWGDSVLKGVVFDTLRNRYALLKDNAVAIISKTLKTPIVNHSRMGQTAPEGLKILREEIDSDLSGSLVVLEYGGNDCDFDWARVAEAPEAEHSPHTPAKQFYAALEQMVFLVREREGFPLLCTLPPLDCQKYLKWITRGGIEEEKIIRYIGVPERIYRWQEYYNALVLRLSATLNCPCLPIREMFLENVRGEEVMCVDGIHPNAAGHRIIAEAALQFAERWKLKPAPDFLPVF